MEGLCSSRNIGSEDLQLASYWSANSQILETIFSFLDLTSLKNARLVRKCWADEAVRLFSNKIILRHHPSLQSTYHEISFFIEHRHLLYALQLSLLDHPWYSDQVESAESDVGDKYYFQENNASYTSAILKHSLTYSVLLLTEIRLEMMISKVSDAVLLGMILVPAKSLKKLALDFLKVSDEAIQSIALQTFSCLTKLRTFAIRMPLTGKEPEGTEVSLDSYKHLLAVFCRINFLDLRSWRQLLLVEENWEKDRICMEALRTLSKSADDLAPDIIGLRIRCPTASIMENLPSPLKYLSIETTSWACNFEELSQSILPPHAQTLQGLEISWARDLADNPPCNGCLPVLSELRYLGLSTNAPALEPIFQPLMADPLNLRNVFLTGKFEHLFPHLTSLVLSLPFPRNGELWEWIFPEESFLGGKIQISTIKYLGVSFAGECNFGVINRIHQIFPQLYILRHFKMDGENFLVCEHRRNQLQQIYTTNIINMLDERFLYGGENSEVFNSCMSIGDQKYATLRDKAWNDIFFW